MNFIDTHCHLDLFDNTEEVLKFSRKTVNKFINPTFNSLSLKKVFEIKKQNKDVFLACGIHPEETKRVDFDYKKEVNFFNNFLEENIEDVIAVGETGFDLEKEGINLVNQSVQENTKLQIQLFKQHIKWAKKFNLPLIIHNRKGNDLFSDLLKDQNLNGVFHCYASSRKFVKVVLNLGFYFGIGGMVTLDEGLQSVVKDIPIEKIVLETDSPYLTPKQIRNEKPFPNTPVNLKYVAESLAEIKDISFEEVAKVTNENAKRLFGI